MKRRFQKIALSATARALNLLNRDASSPSFGCFDRAYWHFKTKDFPSATYQMGLEFLARLWALKDNNNPFFQNPQLLSWIKAGMAYTLRIQHKDGSFDEWYPNERGWAGPTAYVTHSLIKAFEIAGHDLPKDFKGDMQKSFLQAGRFLLKQKEGADLANHYALFLLCLCEISRQVPHFKKEFDFEDALLGFKALVRQEEGWSKEYDSADFSYNLAVLSFLARLDQIHPHPYIKEYAEKSLSFLSYFIYPDGSFGGLGSRETIHLYPLALKYWGQSLQTARAMDDFLQSRGAYERLTPFDQDDHYLFYRLSEYMEADESSFETMSDCQEEDPKALPQKAHDSLLPSVETPSAPAHIEQKPGIKPIDPLKAPDPLLFQPARAKEASSITLAPSDSRLTQEDSPYQAKPGQSKAPSQQIKPPLTESKRILPCQLKSAFEKYFPKTGLFVLKTQAFYLAVNLKRGGALRLYSTSNSQCVLKNTGWVLQRRNKSRLTNASFCETNKITIKEGELRVQGAALFYNSKYFKPLSFAAFRLALAFAKHYKLAFLMKKAIRRWLILRKKKSRFQFERAISYRKQELHIKDIIHCPDGKALYCGGSFSARYVPQSNYFEMSDLSQGPLIFKPKECKKGLVVQQSFWFEEGQAVRQKSSCKALA